MVSKLRLNLMRVVFLLNFLFLGRNVMQALIGTDAWEPVRGVAYSFWGALALLSAFGVRYPLAMLPILFMQLIYKSIWLAAIYPRTADDAGLLPVMAVGVVVDLILIPWAYVFTQARGPQTPLISSSPVD